MSTPAPPPALPAADTLPLDAGPVRLRRLRPDDLAAFQAYRGDAGLARWQGWSPMDEAAARAFLDEMARMPLLRPGDWTQLAIADAASDRLLGDLGLFVAADGSYAEIGFTLARDAQGRGRATAAVAAAIGLLFAHTPVRQVLGITDARNLASVRVLERVGMTRLETREAVFKGEHCIEHVYGRER